VDLHKSFCRPPLDIPSHHAKNVAVFVPNPDDVLKASQKVIVELSALLVAILGLLKLVESILKKLQVLESILKKNRLLEFFVSNIAQLFKVESGLQKKT